MMIWRMSKKTLAESLGIRRAILFDNNRGSDCYHGRFVLAHDLKKSDEATVWWCIRNVFLRNVA